MTKKIAISKFKSRCLEIIEKLQTDHQSIVITKRDKPIATVVPFDNKKISLFGMLKDKAKIKGDITEAINERWEAENE
jgi:prevent-host-death family protein